MNCTKCRKSITSVDTPKRVERRKLPDGTTQDYGIPTFPLSAATGKLQGVFHLKCWYVEKKHNRMGPNGRYIEDSPTAYEMSARYKNADDLSPEAQARAERADAQLIKLTEERTARLATVTVEEVDHDAVGTDDEIHLDDL